MVVGLLLLLLVAGSTEEFSLSDLGSCAIARKECPNENISFYLYTQSLKDNPYKLDVLDRQGLVEAPFSIGQPVKLLFHGYTGDRDYSPNKEIRPAYLEHGDYNVISVDYGPIARKPCYIHAAYSISTVGNCTAQLLDALIDSRVIALQDIHVIGFSLGGQVASQVPLFLRAGQLSRITGLDPALPLFSTIWTSGKLDSSDANFVDVIHTNAGVKGKIESVGHVDFYVNGGTSQPGCDGSYPDGGRHSCSHARAPAYFAESISSKTGFYGYICCTWIQQWVTGCDPNNIHNTVIMGEYTPNSTEGNFYVITNSMPPYALGRSANPCIGQRKK